MVSSTVRCRWCCAPGCPLHPGAPSHGGWLAAATADAWKLNSTSSQESWAWSWMPRHEESPAQLPEPPWCSGRPCCIDGARAAGIPRLEQCRRPGSAGSCRVTMTPLSGLWLPLAVAGLTSFYRVVQQAMGREGRMVSWGAELEPPNLTLGCFWKHCFFIFFNSHSESYFYKFDWTITKKQIFSQIESPVPQPAPLRSLIALKERPCVVLSPGCRRRWNERHWRKKKKINPQNKRK